jgi:hypothetical protein
VVDAEPRARNPDRKSIADRMSKKPGECMLERPKTKNAFRRLDLPGHGGLTNHFSEPIGEGGDWIFGVSFGKIAAAVSQQLRSFVQVLDRLSVT